MAGDLGRFARGHVPGATSLNAHAYEASAPPANKQATLVFYCAGRG